MSVTLYTSKTCAYCPSMKKYLNMKGVDFTEKDGTEADNMEEMMKYTGQRLFPTLVIERESGTRVVSGFNIGKVAEAIST